MANTKPVERSQPVQIRITMLPYGKPDSGGTEYRPKIEHNTDPVNLALSLVSALNVAVPEMVEAMKGMQDRIDELEDPDRIITPAEFLKGN